MIPKKSLERNVRISYAVKTAISNLDLTNIVIEATMGSCTAFGAPISPEKVKQTFNCTAPLAVMANSG